MRKFEEIQITAKSLQISTTEGKHKTQVLSVASGMTKEYCLKINPYQNSPLKLVNKRSDLKEVQKETNMLVLGRLRASAVDTEGSASAPFVTLTTMGKLVGWEENAASVDDSLGLVSVVSCRVLPSNNRRCKPLTFL